MTRAALTKDEGGRVMHPEIDFAIEATLERALTPEQWQCLRELHATGLYGRTIAEVAVGLIGERIRECAAEGWCDLKASEGTDQQARLLPEVEGR